MFLFVFSTLVTKSGILTRKVYQHLESLLHKADLSHNRLQLQLAEQAEKVEVCMSALSFSPPVLFSSSTFLISPTNTRTKKTVLEDNEALRNQADGLDALLFEVQLMNADLQSCVLELGTALGEEVGLSPS